MIDVLIVGAGPAGLSLALELAKYDVSFRIIDYKYSHSIHSKALGIHARTLEMFEKLDVIKQCLERGLPVSGMEYHFGKESVFLQLHNLNTHYPFTLILPQSDTERILEERLNKEGKNVERLTTFLNSTS